MHILVVDDNRHVCEAHTELFHRRGYYASYCRSGAEAIEQIERLRPEVVLVDLAMPQMDGYQVAEKLQHNPDLRPKALIAMTVDNREQVKDKALAMGFDHFFVKPLSWSDLSPILDGANGEDAT